MPGTGAILAVLARCVGALSDNADFARSFASERAETPPGTNMSRKTIRMLLSALAAAMVATLGGPANAKIIGNAFDPTFFDGIGFFLVPDLPCLGLSDGFHAVNPGSEGCSGVLLLSAAVNVADGGGTAHLSLPPPVPSATSITGMVLDSNAASNLVGVNSGLIPILADACTGDLCGYVWYLSWDSGFPKGPDLFNQVFLFRQKLCSTDTRGFCGDITQFGDSATNVTFFATPEPGSLALILGAVGAGWLSRRRKAAA